MVTTTYDNETVQAHIKTFNKRRDHIKTLLEGFNKKISALGEKYNACAIAITTPEEMTFNEPSGNEQQKQESLQNQTSNIKKGYESLNTVLKELENNLYILDLIIDPKTKQNLFYGSITTLEGNIGIRIEGRIGEKGSQQLETIINNAVIQNIEKLLTAKSAKEDSESKKTSIKDGEAPEQTLIHNPPDWQPLINLALQHKKIDAENAITTELSSFQETLQKDLKDPFNSINRLLAYYKECLQYILTSEEINAISRLAKETGTDVCKHFLCTKYLTTLEPGETRDQISLHGAFGFINSLESSIAEVQSDKRIKRWQNIFNGIVANSKIEEIDKEFIKAEKDRINSTYSSTEECPFDTAIAILSDSDEITGAVREHFTSAADKLLKFAKNNKTDNLFAETNRQALIYMSHLLSYFANKGDLDKIKKDLAELQNEFNNKITELQDAAKLLADQLKTQQEELAKQLQHSIDEQLAKKIAEVTALKEDLERKQTELSLANKDLAEQVTSTKTDLETKLAKINAQLATLLPQAQKTAELANKLLAKKEKYKPLKIEKTDNKEAIEALKERVKTNEETIEALQMAFEKKASKDELDKLTTEQSTLNKQLKDLNEKVAALEKNQNTFQTKEDAGKEKAELENKITALDTELKKIDTRICEHIEQLKKDLNKELDSIKKNCEELKQQCESQQHWLRILASIPTIKLQDGDKVFLDKQFNEALNGDKKNAANGLLEHYQSAFTNSDGFLAAAKSFNEAKASLTLLSTENEQQKNVKLTIEKLIAAIEKKIEAQQKQRKKEWKDLKTILENDQRTEEQKQAARKFLGSEKDAQKIAAADKSAQAEQIISHITNNIVDNTTPELKGKDLEALQKLQTESETALKNIADIDKDKNPAIKDALAQAQNIINNFLSTLRPVIAEKQKEDKHKAKAAEKLKTERETKWQAIRQAYDTARSRKDNHKPDLSEDLLLFLNKEKAQFNNDDTINNALNLISDFSSEHDNQINKAEANLANRFGFLNTKIQDCETKTEQLTTSKDSRDCKEENKQPLEHAIVVIGYIKEILIKIKQEQRQKLWKEARKSAKKTEQYIQQEILESLKTIEEQELASRNNLQHQFGTPPNTAKVNYLVALTTINNELTNNQTLTPNEITSRLNVIKIITDNLQGLEATIPNNGTSTEKQDKKSIQHLKELLTTLTTSLLTKQTEQQQRKWENIFTNITAGNQLADGSESRQLITNSLGILPNALPANFANTLNTLITRHNAINQNPDADIAAIDLAEHTALANSLRNIQDATLGTENPSLLQYHRFILGNLANLITCLATNIQQKYDQQQRSILQEEAQHQEGSESEQSDESYETGSVSEAEPEEQQADPFPDVQRIDLNRLQIQPNQRKASRAKQKLSLENDWLIKRLGFRLTGKKILIGTIGTACLAVMMVAAWYIAPAILGFPLFGTMAGYTGMIWTVVIKISSIFYVGTAAAANTLSGGLIGKGSTDVFKKIGAWLNLRWANAYNIEIKEWEDVQYKYNTLVDFAQPQTRELVTAEIECTETAILKAKMITALYSGCHKLTHPKIENENFVWENIWDFRQGMKDLIHPTRFKKAVGELIPNWNIRHKVAKTVALNATGESKAAALRIIENISNDANGIEARAQLIEALLANPCDGPGVARADEQHEQRQDARARNKRETHELILQVINTTNNPQQLFTAQNIKLQTRVELLKISLTAQENEPQNGALNVGNEEHGNNSEEDGIDVLVVNVNPENPRPEVQPRDNRLLITQIDDAKQRAELLRELAKDKNAAQYFQQLVAAVYQQQNGQEQIVNQLIVPLLNNRGKSFNPSKHTTKQLTARALVLITEAYESRLEPAADENSVKLLLTARNDLNRAKYFRRALTSSYLVKPFRENPHTLEKCRRHTFKKNINKIFKNHGDQTAIVIQRAFAARLNLQLNREQNIFNDHHQNWNNPHFRVIAAKYVTYALGISNIGRRRTVVNSIISAFIAKDTPAEDGRKQKLLELIAKISNDISPTKLDMLLGIITDPDNLQTILGLANPPAADDDFIKICHNLLKVGRLQKGITAADFNTNFTDETHPNELRENLQLIFQATLKNETFRLIHNANPYNAENKIKATIQILYNIIRFCGDADQKNNAIVSVINGFLVGTDVADEDRNIAIQNLLTQFAEYFSPATVNQLKGIIYNQVENINQGESNLAIFNTILRNRGSYKLGINDWQEYFNCIWDTTNGDAQAKRRACINAITPIIQHLTTYPSEFNNKILLRILPAYDNFILEHRAEPQPPEAAAQEEESDDSQDERMANESEVVSEQPAANQPALFRSGFYEIISIALQQNISLEPLKSYTPIGLMLTNNTQEACHKIQELDGNDEQKIAILEQIIRTRRIPQNQLQNHIQVRATGDPQEKGYIEAEDRIQSSLCIWIIGIFNHEPNVENRTLFIQNTLLAYIDSFDNIDEKKEKFTQLIVKIAKSRFLKASQKETFKKIFGFGENNIRADSIRGKINTRLDNQLDFLFTTIDQSYDDASMARQGFFQRHRPNLGKILEYLPFQGEKNEEKMLLL